MPTKQFIAQVRRAALAAILGGLWCVGWPDASLGQTSAPGPRDVIGYAQGDLTGPSMTWSLPEGRPYIYVPYIGEEMKGAVAGVRIGAQVGAILFQRPLFASRDIGCTPVLGTDARPRLKWLGATARFEPGGAGMPPGAMAQADPQTGGYGSLILFDKELGPPPGVLLMHRRRTMGMMCDNPTHKTFYSRLFVPVAAATMTETCVDLNGQIQVSKTKFLPISFTRADRVALLSPADLSNRYDDIRHRFTATLFNRPGCTGEALRFDSETANSEAAAAGNIKLETFGFRDRARSVLMTYKTGALTPFLVASAQTENQVATAEPPPQPASQAAARKPAASVAPQLDLPEPRAAPGPAIASATQKIPPSPVRAPGRQPKPVSKNLAPQPQAIATATPNTKVMDVAALPKSPGTKSPGTKSPGSKVSGSSPTTPKATLLATPVGADTATKLIHEGTPKASDARMAKLLPVLLPSTAGAGKAAKQVFSFPTHDIYRLNYCLGPDKACGKAAAETWCKTLGYRQAKSWSIDENIGALFPTVMLAANRICANSDCDGFQEITCTR